MHNILLFHRLLGYGVIPAPSEEILFVQTIIELGIIPIPTGCVEGVPTAVFSASIITPFPPIPPALQIYSSISTSNINKFVPSYIY